MLDLEEGGIPPPLYRTPKIPTLIKVKVKNGISLEIMRESFVIKQDETYNLKSGNHLAQRNIQITQYGTESVLNFRAKLWNLLTRKIKKISFLTFFKNKIRKWIPEKCPCKFCQTYMKNAGYIWFLSDICTKWFYNTRYMQKNLHFLKNFCIWFVFNHKYDINTVIWL